MLFLVEAVEETSLYMSIPPYLNVTGSALSKKYGDPVELIKEQCMKDRLKIDDAARTFFEDYRYDKAGEMVSLTERKKRNTP